MTRRILICYDGSEESARALQFAVALLQQSNGETTEFHLAYVVQKPSNIADPVPDELLDAFKKEGDEVLSDAARYVRSS